MPGLSFRQRRRLEPIQGDGSMGASGDAGITAVAQVGIDEWRLARIDLQDGFGAADLAGQAFAARLTPIVDHARYGCDLRFCRSYHGFRSLHPSALGQHSPPPYTPLGYQQTV